MGLRELALGSAFIIPLGVGGYFITEQIKERDLAAGAAIQITGALAIAIAYGTFIGYHIRDKGERRDQDRERTEHYRGRNQNRQRNNRGRGDR